MAYFLLKKSFFAASLFTIVLTAAVHACNVPVYRFALERWPGNNYDVVVFHGGDLTAEERSAIDMLFACSNRKIPYSNYVLTTVNLETDMSKEYKRLLNNLGDIEFPRIVLRYPKRTGITNGIWHAALTEANVRIFIDSPVRRQIAEHILDNESGVWVLLESGNHMKDDAAAKLLETELREMEESLTLPEQIFETLMPNKNDPRLAKLKISFTLIRLSRENPAEAPLVAMLTNSESDLAEYASSPMAFPVYGRGRALFPLIGAGITADNIRSSCAFLTGACACEVKADNPGFDLLFSTDWDASVGESWIETTNIPPLVGLSEMLNGSVETDTRETINENAVADISGNPEPVAAGDNGNYRLDRSYSENGESSGRIFGNTMITIGVLFIFISYMSSRIVKMQTRRKR